MFVITDNVTGSGSNGAIYKLIIIFIAGNQLKMVIGCNKFHIVAVDEILDYIFSDYRCCLFRYDFLIFH